MKWRLTIVVLSLLFAFCAKGQSAPADNRQEATQQLVLAKPSTSNSTLTQSTSVSSNTFVKALANVLFATNDDCQLFINDELQGLVSKNRFSRVWLITGTYRYVAKSVATGDEWRDTFSVRQNGVNEVFIDMLYTIDVGREARSIDGGNPGLPVANSPAANNDVAGAAGIRRTVVSPELLQATVTEILQNLVPVEGGAFVMGNGRSPSADEAEHRVTVNSFFINKYEVTQQQWERIMGYNPSFNKGCSDCPVENVSWEEAMNFVRKLNGISSRRFRLPTEAEWEYVVKLGGKSEIDKAGGAEAFIKKSAWAFINSQNKTHPVGQKQPNVAGVYDLHGNVSEWCMDWYEAAFYKQQVSRNAPLGPPVGKEKVFRGGSFKDYSGDRLRPSIRSKLDPKEKESSIGFRLAMEWQD